MIAFRCPECGDTRWDPLGLLKLTGPPPACPLCDAPMVEERRRPGRAPIRTAVERRDGAEPPVAAAPSG